MLSLPFLFRPFSVIDICQLGFWLRKEPQYFIFKIFLWFYN